MAKVFLDTNYFIDFAERRKDSNLTQLEDHPLFISPLSIHVLAYAYKYKLPHKKLENFIQNFTLISFDKNIVDKAVSGPTADFEDNVQLHSAAEGDCEFFLTQDQDLLKLRYFGKTEIVSRLK